MPKFERHKMPHYAAKYHLLAYFGGDTFLVGGDWNMTFIFPYIEDSHTNWLIFFRWDETTNQFSSVGHGLADSVTQPMAVVSHNTFWSIV